jgi:organic hydroperoxide reductase OsmC/OhrA
MRTHSYAIRNVWTGNKGSGTSAYNAYGREHELGAAPKITVIPCSSEPVFRGNPERYNPEELLLGAISGCHMLWFLHFCADAGVVVTHYEDNATASMQEDGGGAGRFIQATLHPVVTITDPGRTADVQNLHERVHNVCAIARSVNFPVHVEPRTEVVKTL